MPHRFAREAVEVRLTGRTVKVFAKGERIAAHLRSGGNGKHTTVQGHMLSSHRYADRTVERIRRDALSGDQNHAARDRSQVPGSCSASMLR